MANTTDKKTVIITDAKEIEELYSMAEENDMSGILTEENYLLYGYLHITDGAKNTLRAIKNIQDINEKQKKYFADVSISYLATALSTIYETQVKRVKILKEAGLLIAKQRQYKVNRFIIPEIKPDRTFKDVLANLVKRKELAKLLSDLKYFHETKKKDQKEEAIKKIEKLLAEGVTHYNTEYMLLRFS